MPTAYPGQTSRIGAALLWFALSAPAAVAGDADLPDVGEQITIRTPRECGVVRHLTVRRSNVFGAEESHARLFYGRWANRLHAVTREAVVRRGLHFAPGDSVCRDDLEAAVRRLRGYRFLREDIDVAVEAAPGDSIDIEFHTRDAWTTRPTLEFRKDGKVTTWSMGLEESNVLGLGKGAGLELGRGEVKTFYGGWYRDPQFTRSDVLFYAELFEGDDLWLRGLLVERPYERPRTPWGLHVQAQTFRGIVVDHRGGVDGPEWHTDQWLVKASGGARLWGRGETALRAGPAVHLLRERYRPPDAGSDAPALPGEALAARDVRMVGVELDFARSRYSERTGINAFHRSEDFDLGTTLQLRAGYSPRRWGAARDGWMFTGEGTQGLSLGRHRFLLGAFRGEGQWVDGRAEDVRIQAAVNGYANLDRRQTLAVGVRHGRGTRMAPQAVYTLGAITGLRGHESYSYWGERILAVNLEDRIAVAENLFGLVTAGVTLFTDWGLAWRPGRHEEARPRGALGLGLRLLGSRTAGLLVTRIDVGFPLAGAPDDAGPVVSIGAGQAF